MNVKGDGDTNRVMIGGRRFGPIKHETEKHEFATTEESVLISSNTGPNSEQLKSAAQVEDYAKDSAVFDLVKPDSNTVIQMNMVTSKTKGNDGPIAKILDSKPESERESLISPKPVEKTAEVVKKAETKDRSKQEIIDQLEKIREELADSPLDVKVKMKINRNAETIEKNDMIDCIIELNGHLEGDMNENELVDFFSNSDGKALLRKINLYENFLIDSQKIRLSEQGIRKFSGTEIINSQ